LIRISRHYVSNIFFLIFVGDIAILLASVALTYWEVDWVGEGVFWPKIVVLAATTLLLFYLSDLYNFQPQLDIGELILRIGMASTIAAVLTAATGLRSHPYGSAAWPSWLSPPHQVWGSWRSGS
jgi:hypothetical protein